MNSIKNIYSALTVIIFAVLFIASAATKDYYQVYKTVPENGKLLDNKITFEDENCNIVYNLWGEGGNIGFTIFNKSENEIIINIDKSFFVLNGIAYDYFQNRTITKTSTSGSSVSYTYPYWYYSSLKVGGTSTSSYATSYSESPLMIIPSKTSKNITEYNVVNNFYSSCDLLKYPFSKKEIKSLSFDKTNSPYTFYNIISYTSKGINFNLENKFYVDQIANFPRSEIVETIYPEKCGKESSNYVEVFKETPPNNFYFHYIKGNDTNKH